MGHVSCKLIGIYISFTLDKPDWRHRGVQDLPRHQRRQDNQTCGVLVYWNLCYHVRFRGLLAFGEISLHVVIWEI